MQINTGTAAVEVLGCLMLLIGSSVAFGQETRASLGGEVTDPKGGLIPQATVVVTADDTGVVQKVTTSATGQWRVKFLNPGLYHFEVSAAGFQTIEYTSVELQVGDEKTIDSRLQIASQSQAVTVDADEIPLIDTTAAVSGTVITAEEMAEVPSLSNAPTMLLGITPGATVGSGSAGGVYLWSNIGLSQSSVNGTGFNQGTSYPAINYTLDGGSDTNNLGEVAYEPPMDSVGEFKVVANAYDASIGRNLGTTITLQSKTGTRSIHGDLYEINQNNFLNANSYQYDAQTPPTPQAPIHTNYYGGAVGGPIWIPKLYDGRKKGLFFFLSWSGIRNQAPVNAGFASVPTAAERAGDFSQSYIVSAGVKYPINIYDPNTVVSTNPPTNSTFQRTQFPGNIIPAARLDPVAVAIMKLLPLPNAPPLTTSGNDVNNYVRHEVQNDKMVTYSLRLDKAWNNANHSYVNVRQNNWSELSLDPFGPTFYLNNFYQTRLNRGLTLDHSIALNKDFLLDLGYNIIRYNPNTFSGSAGINPTTLGYSTNFASQMQLPSIPLIENIFTGVEKSGLGTNNAGNNTFDTNQDLTGSITQSYKNHTFHYGLEYMVQQEAVSSLGMSGGFFTFDTNWDSLSPVGTVPIGSGSAMASFMLGLPNGGGLPIAATAFWSQHYAACYFQDNWRVNKRLTLNLGLRWDFQRPVTERFNRFANRFDPNFVVTSVTSAAQANYASVIAGSSGNNTGLALLQAQRPNVSGFVAKGGLLYAGLNGTSNTVENPVYKYYQPRLGFAYQLFENTVIRGGLGRFVQADFNTAGQPGYSQTTNFTPTTNNYESVPAISMENPYPNGIVPVTGNSLGELTNIGSVGSYTDPNIGRIYVDAFSASVQQQFRSFLFEVGFTFDKTHGISMGWEANNPSPAAWHAGFDPQFTSTGAPVVTLPGNTPVTNPFYQVAGIQTSLSDYTSKTIVAYNLLRPNPLLGNLTDNRGTGQVRYYALNAKVERRFKQGFSVLQSFSWSKSLTADRFIGPQVAGARIFHTLSPNDLKYHYVLTPVYELPFGRGKQFLNHASKLVDELAGGWEFTGIYQFQSGTPLNLPTNSAFFQGGNPGLGKNKTPGQWFNTAMFLPYPTSSTTVAKLATYPSWTGVGGLPGASYVPASGTTTCTAVCNGVFNDFTSYHITYNQQVFGNIRNPYITDFTLGVRKNFKIYEGVSFQLGIDAFNALNHPRFGNIDTNPNDTYFGAISGGPPSNWVQINSPRTIQLRGRLTF